MGAQGGWYWLDRCSAGRVMATSPLNHRKPLLPPPPDRPPLRNRKLPPPLPNRGSRGSAAPASTPAVIVDCEGAAAAGRSGSGRTGSEPSISERSLAGDVTVLGAPRPAWAKYALPVAHDHSELDGPVVPQAPGPFVYTVWWQPPEKAPPSTAHLSLRDRVELRLRAVPAHHYRWAGACAALALSCWLLAVLLLPHKRDVMTRDVMNRARAGTIRTTVVGDAPAEGPPLPRVVGPVLGSGEAGSANVPAGPRHSVMREGLGGEGAHPRGL